MEGAFEKLKKDGQNNIDNLVKWLKSSKVVDESPESESKARKLLEEAKDKTNVEFSHFQETISKLAADQKKSPDDFSKMLSDGAQQMQEALASAANALKNAMSSK